MKRILIIEDDTYILDIYMQTFTQAGYEVVCAPDGEKGLEAALNQPFDMILLDIMLPKMNGIEVLKKLRAEGSIAKEKPVFLITNLGQEDIIQQAFTIGADGYLIKSQLTPKDILNEIEIFFHVHEHSSLTS